MARWTLGRVGVAVPISVPEQGLAASLSLVLNERSFDKGVEARMLHLLASSAARLQPELSLGSANALAAVSGMA